MKTKTFTIIASICLILTACGKQEQDKTKEIVYDAPIVFAPPTYVCYKAPVTITIDGVLSSEEWDLIPWTSDFVNVTAGKEPKPFFQTRVKMTYDDDGLYIAGWMEESHVWSDMTEHDSPLYLNNNFEFFFDLLGNTHTYVEYEVTALGTEWDLYLTKPYRDGGLALSNWEFNGMKSAVYVDGTVNNPKDTDKSWSAEIFLPWRSLYQLVSGKRKPEAGDQIRANFSRSQWNHQIEDGKYVKIPYEGDRIDNRFWAWAPSDVKDIHKPEFWGIVQFSDHQAGTGDDAFVKQGDDNTKWILRNLYYRQNKYFKTFGKYAETLADLKADEVCPKESVAQLTLSTTPSLYEISLPTPNGRVWRIRQDGLVWSN